jgi:hypothetical protein
LILLAIVATGLSYIVAHNCGYYPSQLCRDARVIPNAIADYLADKPETKKVETIQKEDF